MPSARLFPVFTGLLILTIISWFIALAVGSVSVPLAELFSYLSGQDNDQAELILKLRAPRALAAWLTGAMLALAGCLMQVLLRNPLADPYILGVSGGAACAALTGITLGVASVWLPPLAFGGAMLAMITVFGLARGRGAWSATRLLLTGVVLAAGWGALISLILALSPDNSLRGMLFWLMGDLSLASMPVWSNGLFVLIFALSMLRARSLNVLAMGETTARLLGEDSTRLQWLIYLLASLLTAAAVAIAGSIGFVGLIIPHMMRLLVGSDHRLLLPAATLFGGSFLLLADTAARTLMAPQQLPVGVITALAGVPLFLLLLNRARLSQ